MPFNLWKLWNTALNNRAPFRVGIIKCLYSLTPYQMALNQQNISCRTPHPRAVAKCHDIRFQMLNIDDDMNFCFFNNLTLRQFGD